MIPKTMQQGFVTIVEQACGSVRISYNSCRLFEAVNKTLVTFASDPKHLGAQGGHISVLHTWVQNLSYHPHIHCIVPAGGITQNGLWKMVKKGKGN